MIFWGFVMWLVGGVAGIMAILVSLRSVLNMIDALGFSGYMARLFDPQFLTVKKILFLVALLLVIVGLIVYFMGRAKAKRTGDTGKSGAKALKYWKDMKGEYRKIIWPTWKTVLKNTAVTLFVCALVAIFVCLVDFGLSSLVDLLLSL